MAEEEKKLGYTALPSFRSVNVTEEIVLDLVDSEIVWVPLAEGVWMAPQVFDCTNGGWTNLIRIAPGGQLACHYHTGPVHGYTISGSWRYLEHNWVANVGTYIYEPNGEMHTLVADPVDGMTTLFVTHGCLVFVNAEGEAIGFEDCFSRLEKCRRHYEATDGLDPAVLDAMIR